MRYLTSSHLPDTGCYAWNFHECLSRSIYNPPTPPPTPSPPSPQGALFDKEPPRIVWSDYQSVLKGQVSWRWTVRKVATVTPQLIVELIVAEDTSSAAPGSYIGFGVAPQLMQGALVVCAPETAPQGLSRGVSATCQTLFGEGMGTTVPRKDPVKPRVLAAYRNNATSYTVRFAASLFACWAEPRLPARVLFAQGAVSGNGAPQPHLNDGRHREAVTGIDFLSVVKGYNVDKNRPDTPRPKFPEALPARRSWSPLSTQQSIKILQGRVDVTYQLFQHEGTEIVSIQLQNVALQDNSYIGFAFAENTMTGLVMTCAPQVRSKNRVTAKCHQWRGRGTNLYPLYPTEDAGGWFLTGIQIKNQINGTHVDYTFSGRVADVVQAHGKRTDRPLSSKHLRVICAIGRSAPGSGTPLIHQARDRMSFRLEGLVPTDASNLLSATSNANSDAGPATGSWAAFLLPTLFILGFFIT